MQDHRRWRVWQRAQELCVQVYVLTGGYPAAERFGLTAQLRRAAVSVGANIAEASRRASRPDKRRILNVAQSEAAEVMSELDVGCRLQYRGRDTAEKLVAEYDGLGGSLERLRERILEGSDDETDDR
jgi:four helix bundle protein